MNKEEVAKEMKGWGFSRGKYNPCLYFHKARGLRTFLHGDDFATVGAIENVSWLKDLLEKRFEIKTECISPAAAGVGSRKAKGDLGRPSPKTTNGEAIVEGVEARLLNRAVKVTHIQHGAEKLAHLAEMSIFLKRICENHDHALLGINRANEDTPKPKGTRHKSPSTAEDGPWHSNLRKPASG